jgi:hypothetical protein
VGWWWKVDIDRYWHKKMIPNQVWVDEPGQFSSSASSMMCVPGQGVCWDVHATTVKGAMAHIMARKTSNPVSHVWLDESVGGVYTDDIITR